MTVQKIIENITERLKTVPGVHAVVLGGSRAKGTHTPKSDIDIGIYYFPDTPLDIPALSKAAADIDDQHREQLLTGIGGWGAWVNGGGWLTVQNMPVDFIYRDLSRVSNVVEQCLAGNITIDYHPGHPHGFVNCIYMSEIALCKPLWDPEETISRLKAKTIPYPESLKKALIAKFLWEAEFSLRIIPKSAARNDASHASGLLFRAVSCLNQALFAVNERYWMNETGALDIADGFPKAPVRYKERVNEVFSLLSYERERIMEALGRLEEIVRETEQLTE